MHARSFRFDASQLNFLFAPRKPRTPLLRLLFGLVGLVLLAVLVFFGVFVGAAMLAAGMAWRLLARRTPRTPAAARQTFEAEYRVVQKPQLPTPR
ncbi:hypothetical protein [Pseudoxanthomonas suwonensis]|jgi:hypothetical protein|uniref:hypothetical protein n=1 Tax=Pseudoxanthomonas suwonensis TaxID=314722 RepID=UPI0004920C46|nr:hypothetical protein [Pseudoxanthomonas suwonensis]